MSRRQLDRGAPHLPEGGQGDDSGCTILHVDMDAFFASVEERDRPELRGRPVIVGGAGARGVVSAANYAARAFGVHSAMPMSRARRLCPQAVVVPPAHGKYGEVSAAVMQVLQSVTPEVEPLALDEAFLDISGAVRRLGPPGEIAALIRGRVHAEQELTCSVGAASTKFVAKLASTHCKPDGLLVVPDERVVEFLHPLPCGALWGVGDRTEEALKRLGLRTVGDIAHTPEAVLQRELGQALGAHLAALAWGRDPRPVVTSTPDKSIGHETTFDRDVADPEVIRRALLRLSESTAARLRATGQACRTVSVKLRRADFTTFTRSRTLPEPTDGTQRIYATACALYAAAGVQRQRLRLVGVRAENLTDAATAPYQLTFLDEHGHSQRETGWSEADRAIDRVTRRFGRGAVRPASLVRPEADAEPPSAP